MITCSIFDVTAAFVPGAGAGAPTAATGIVPGADRPLHPPIAKATSESAAMLRGALNGLKSDDPMIATSVHARP